MMRVILTRGDVRDATYTQSLDVSASAPDVTVQDKNRIVVADSYRLIYRINSTYL